MYYCFKEGLYYRGILHDINKFRPSNFLAYANYFYLKNGKGKFIRDKTGYYDASNTNDKSFDYAWHYHQRTNKHHWQYYCLPKDDGTFKCLDMPEVYIIEMLCDWRGAGRAQKTNPDGTWQEVLRYYKSNKTKMYFTSSTRQQFEEILDKKVYEEQVHDLVENLKQNWI